MLGKRGWGATPASRRSELTARRLGQASAFPGPSGNCRRGREPIVPGRNGTDASWFPGRCRGILVLQTSTGSTSTIHQTGRA